MNTKKVVSNLFKVWKNNCNFKKYFILFNWLFQLKLLVINQFQIQFKLFT